MAKRRGHGEGSIYQRESDGRWVGAVDLGWHGGKRKRRYVYGSTQAEVREKVTRLLHDKDRGFTIPTERQTVEQFFTRWLSDVVEGSRRPSTVKAYRQNVRLHILPLIGPRQLAKVTPQEIQSLIRDRQRYGLAPQTVRHILALLRMAFDQAVRWGMIARNPATETVPPKVEKFEGEILDRDQSRRFVEAARDDRLEALWVLAITTGLRKGEILGLRWPDVNLDEGEIRVSRSMQRIGGRLQLVELKTARSRRTVLLTEDTVSALRRHRARQLEERLIAGSRWQEFRLVFSSTIGTPVDGAHLSIFLNRLLATAALPKVRFHDLRHSAATLMLGEGVSARVIADTLGHSDVSTTLRIYAHVRPSLQRDATDRMQSIFTGGKTAEKRSS